MTEEQKRKAKDKRLRKLYGITIQEYDEILEKQGGGCAICGRPPVTKSLSVDHDHKWKYLKIVHYTDDFAGFLAKVEAAYGRPLVARRYLAARGWGSTKREASKHLKQQLKRLSVRGLIDFSCNGGLRKFSDNPDLLRYAADYLQVHQGSIERL